MSFEEFIIIELILLTLTQCMLGVGIYMIGIQTKQDDKDDN